MPDYASDDHSHHRLIARDCKRSLEHSRQRRAEQAQQAAAWWRRHRFWFDTAGVALGAVGFYVLMVVLSAAGG